MSNPYFSSSFAPQPRVFSIISSGGRPIGSSFKLSTHRDSFVSYSLNFTGVLTNPSGALEISSDGTNWFEICRTEGTSGHSGNIQGLVPKNYFVRILQLTATISVVSGQEVLL